MMKAQTVKVEGYISHDLKVLLMPVILAQIQLITIVQYGV